MRVDLSQKYKALQGRTPASTLNFESARNKVNQQTIQAEQQSQFPTEQPEEVQRSFSQKLSGFLGIEKFGQGIGQTLAYHSGSKDNLDEIQAGQNDMAQKLSEAIRKNKAEGKDTSRLVASLKALTGDTVQTGDDAESLLNPNDLNAKEVIGSAANVGLNILTPSAFKGGLAATVGKNAALGAGFGLAGGLDNNEDIGGIIKSSLLGAGIGSAIPIAGRGASKVKDLVGKGSSKVASLFMNQAIKPTLNDLRKNIKFGSKTLGEELLQEGVAGSPKKMLGISENRLNQFETELQDVLRGSKGVITREDIVPYFEKIKADFQLTPGSKDQISKIDELIYDLPAKMNLETANKVKRNLYQRLRDVAFKLDASLSDKKEGMKVLANGLKQEIEKKSDNPAVVQELNRKLSIYGRLEDNVVDILARQNRNKLIGLTDNMTLLASFVNPLAFLALIGKKAVENTRVLSNTANQLNKVKNIGTGKAGQVIKDTVKRGLLNIP